MHQIIQLLPVFVIWIYTCKKDKTQTSESYIFVILKERTIFYKCWRWTDPLVTVGKSQSVNLLAKHDVFRDRKCSMFISECVVLIFNVAGGTKQLILTTYITLTGLKILKPITTYNV